MTGLFVNVQLEVLIVHEKAPSGLDDLEMSIICLIQQIIVIPGGHLSLHLHILAIRMGPPDRVDITPVTLLATFPQSSLHPSTRGLQVMVLNIEILKWRES